jgi:hypothetical protein
MVKVVIEDKVILCAHHLFFIYSQFVTLYDIIPYAPRSLTYPTNPKPRHHVDSLVGSISHAFFVHLANQMVM